MNFISVLSVFFLVHGQRLHFSISKLLSHFKIKEYLDSDYQEQQFVITEDSFYAVFLFRVELINKYTTVTSKMCSTMSSNLKWALPNGCSLEHFCLCVVSLSLSHIFYKSTRQTNNHILVLNTFLHKK